MTPAAVFLKDPAAVLDYSLDFTDWLVEGEVLTAASWSVPGGLTKDSDTFSSTSTTVWLSDGTVGTDYTVTAQVSTATRTDERSVLIKVRNR